MSDDIGNVTTVDSGFGRDGRLKIEWAGQEICCSMLSINSLALLATGDGGISDEEIVDFLVASCIHRVSANFTHGWLKLR
ncbi:hypothetical protein LWI28_012049 [Acer negundo]|uniref:Uncharacterized protein n=1 Tax=Acer negundo TaxID=4023 RepID=A0AAD5JP38_ACENE|nr:hypothetical protein LWI28_012049 [Acer negundo]